MNVVYYEQVSCERGLLQWCRSRTVARKFSMGGLCVCLGGLTYKNLQKLHLFIVFDHVSIWGAKPTCVGGGGASTPPDLSKIPENLSKNAAHRCL